MQELRSGTLLQGGKYRIIKVLGQGGFGITYLAENTLIGGFFTIKEYFFRQCCQRYNATPYVIVPNAAHQDIVNRHKIKFLKEAHTLFRFDHPNIIKVHEVFEENATAYYVMDFVEGEALDAVVSRCGFIPEREAIQYIREVAKALSYIHSRYINHLDVKPDNIMIRRLDGRVILIDFGVSKQYDHQTLVDDTTTPIGVTHGFSPAEQYLKDGVRYFSPQSDVYALAATLYNLLTGVLPPESIIVQSEGLPIERLINTNVSKRTVHAIVEAMRGYAERTQTVDEFISNLTHGNNSLTRLLSSSGFKLKHIAVAVLFPVIIIATFTLAYFGYEYFSRHSFSDEEYIASVSNLPTDMPEETDVPNASDITLEDIEKIRNDARQANERTIAEEDRTRRTVEEAVPIAETPSATREESRTSVEDKVFDVVEVMPQFPGGQSELMRYLASNIKYPVVAQENGIQGRVVVKFIVEPDGYISNVIVVKSVDPSLDNEAVRVVRAMPRWIPGQYHGQKVRVNFNVPVSFRLQ